MDHVRVGNDLPAAPFEHAWPEIVAKQRERSSRSVEVRRATFRRPYVATSVRVEQHLSCLRPNLSLSTARIHRGVAGQRLAVWWAKHVDVIERDEPGARAR